MSLRLVTPPDPDAEPLTLDEAKQHLRLEIDDDDDFVSKTITAAREYVEQYCWRGAMTQTWELILPGFEGCEQAIDLPKGDVQSVSFVHYVDPTGVQQTLDPSLYSLEDQAPAKLHRVFGERWPHTRRQWDAVRVRYVLGWATADDVPISVKHAMLLLIGELYEFRTLDIAGLISQVSLSTNALLQPYRLMRL